MAHQLRNRLNAAWAGLPLRSKGLVVIAIPLGALLAGLVCFYLLGKAEDRQETAVAHTVEVRSELHQLLIHLVDAETGMRGFLLSRREEFLEPYHAGLKALPESLSRVSDLIQDDPQQIARLREVRLLVTARMEKLTSVMETAAAESALPSARTTAGLLEGKAIMNALRQELDRMDQEEARLMDARGAALDRVRNWSLAAFVASGLFGVLGGVAAMLIFSKGVVLRMRVLKENTRRLAEETPLLPAPARSDEIGRLEQGVQAASRLLAARGDALRAETGRLSAEVAERLRTGQALRESEERWKFALETSGLGAWELNLADHTAWRSLRHDQIFGYQELLPEWTHEIVQQHVLEADRPMMEQGFQRAIAERTPWSFECRIRRADGPERWIWAYGKTIRDADGCPIRMFGLVADITERKLAEATLRQNASLFATLVEQAPGGVYVVDAQFRLQQVNAQAQAVFASVRPLIGRDFAEVMEIVWGPEIGAQCTAIFRHTLATGEP